MAWKTLPVAEFAPDMPEFHPKFSQNVLNVIARTPESYGPFPSMAAFSSALGSRCQGAYACLDNSGDVYVFAGDATDLFELTASSATFANVSKSSGGYGIAATERWNLTLFGQRVIAADFADPLQAFLLGTSSAFADLAYGGITALTLTGGSGYTNGTYALSPTSTGGGTGFAGTVTVSGGALTSYSITNPGELYGSSTSIPIPAGAGSGNSGAIAPTIATVAPKARYIANVKNFLCAGNTWDPVNGAQPQCVWWSALNDPTNWPTPGTVTAAEYQSDYNNLYGDGGWIQGVVGNLGTADGAVLMEHAVWRMLYVGPPAVFDFFPAQGVKGCPAPGSIVQLGNLVYYLGEDGFYAFDGTNVTPIGANRVDKWFFSNLDQSNISRVVGTVDPINKQIIWAAPFLMDATGGAPSRLVCYNWQLDRWTMAEVTLETVLRALTFGYTLDQLYTVLGYTIDTLPAPLDSRLWTGGQIALAAFDTTHKLNFFTGPNLAPTVDLGELQLFPGKVSVVKNARPLVDGGTPTVSIGTRNRTVDQASFNAGTAMNAIGTCPQRATGRYVRGRITLPAGSSFSHIQGCEVEATAAGAR